jgi:NADPH-dependent 2,4-dienoyl-CoA reductase/sulfur reductase-like enzyme
VAPICVGGHVPGQVVAIWGLPRRAISTYVVFSEAGRGGKVDMKKSPKIAFVGSGAQGSGVAADLVRAGLDVTLIEQWPRHVEAIRAHDRTEITRIPALQAGQLRADPPNVALLLAVPDTDESSSASSRRQVR